MDAALTSDLTPYRASLLADAQARRAEGRDYDPTGTERDKANELMRRCEARGLSGVTAWELTLQLLGH